MVKRQQYSASLAGCPASFYHLTPLHYLLYQFLSAFLGDVSFRSRFITCNTLILNHNLLVNELYSTNQDPVFMCGCISLQSLCSDQRHSEEYRAKGAVLIIIIIIHLAVKQNCVTVLLAAITVYLP